jgi:S-methylmethionine-dependent homocysteine/selenocysteine methylase
MMSKYRNRLPQLAGQLFAADGGIETSLIFHDRIELPHFAAFDLFKTQSGTETLRRHYLQYARIARRHGLGIVLESPTWRASTDWGRKLGYSDEALADANRLSIGLLLEVREAVETSDTPIVISGNLGPRGDGYRPGQTMSAPQAADYHRMQIDILAHTDADLISAFTMNYVDEAVGIAQAARAAGMPVVLSFTLETDGALPSGQLLGDAIQATDDATGGYPLYYMINCAHPTHFEHVLEGAGAWRERIRGIRANASRRSHAELDDSTDLDEGDPAELAGQYRRLRAVLPQLAVVGGCCGTDERHVDAICIAMTGRELADAA